MVAPRDRRDAALATVDRLRELPERPPWLQAGALRAAVCQLSGVVAAGRSPPDPLGSDLSRLWG